jgi:hypothetical protein
MASGQSEQLLHALGSEGGSEQVASVPRLFHPSFPRLKFPVTLAISSWAAEGEAFEIRSRKRIAFDPVMTFTVRLRHEIATEPSFRTP